MTWPIEQDPDDEVHQLPLTTLFRWYLYDMEATDPNKSAEIFDLMPVSQEGDDKEREDSEIRLYNIEPLMSFINLYSNMNAEYIFETQKLDLLKMPNVSEEMLENEINKLKALYSTITYAGLTTAISAAVELRLISLNGTFTGIK